MIMITKGKFKSQVFQQTNKNLALKDRLVSRKLTFATTNHLNLQLIYVLSQSFTVDWRYFYDTMSVTLYILYCIFLAYCTVRSYNCETDKVKLTYKLKMLFERRMLIAKELNIEQN